MAVDLTVKLPSAPGSLAQLGEALGVAGINIEAIAAFETDGDEGMAHLVVQDVAAANAALAAAGITVESRREALVVTLRHEPGALGQYARKLADHGVNIEALYLAGEAGDSVKVVLVVEDPESVRALKH